MGAGHSRNAAAGRVLVGRPQLSVAGDSGDLRFPGRGAAPVATGADGVLPVPAAPPGAGRHRQDGGMNEDLFYGPAAMRLRAAERHFGKLAPSDQRIVEWEDRKARILWAYVCSREGLMGVPLPDAPPEPIDRSVLAKRLADRNGELALWLLCETVPRSFWRFPVNEFAELSRKGWDVLRTGRSGKLLGISFIASRVFDLRGLPPAAAATLYGEEPLLSAEDQMRLRWPQYSPRGSRAPSEIRRDVDRHQRESLLGYLRAGELLGTGVAEGRREPVPAAEWPQEIAAITEAFDAGRLGRWRDLLVRAPELSQAPLASAQQVTAPSGQLSEAGRKYDDAEQLAEMARLIGEGYRPWKAAFIAAEHAKGGGSHESRRRRLYQRWNATEEAKVSSISER